MIIASLLAALLLPNYVDRVDEGGMMDNFDNGLHAFQEECRTSFESMVEGRVTIVSHNVIKRDADTTFVSSYLYKVETDDGKQRGPYKFECRKHKDEKMFIYSEF